MSEQVESIGTLLAAPHDSDTSVDSSTPLVSVVVPTLNEESVLAATLESVRSQDIAHEIIVVDAGSWDRTQEIAEAYSCHLLISSPGRGRQLHLGAEASKAETLLFLHADTRLPPGALTAVHFAMKNAALSGGKFRLRFDSEHPVLRLASYLTRFKGSWCSFGDQGIFVRRAAYKAAGGFEDIPLFEDVRFLHRLQGQGALSVLPHAVMSSARRFRERGVVRQYLTNGALLLAHRFGVNPRRLAAFYDRWYVHEPLR